LANTVKLAKKYIKKIQNNMTQLNNNLKLITENKKPFEMVQEVDNKYQIPSFEKFMETYGYDNNLNYDDLVSGDISEARGYGPCTSSNCTHSRSELQNQLRETQRELDSLQSQLSRASS
jgi:hypothetical protein